MLFVDLSVGLVYRTFGFHLDWFACYGLFDYFGLSVGFTSVLIVSSFDCLLLLWIPMVYWFAYLCLPFRIWLLD